MGKSKQQHWLVKFAPFRTSWSEIVRTGTFTLRGVRSPEARNNLRKMQLHDPVLFYHSQQELAVVGLMEVYKTAYPDPTSADCKWLTCDFIPRRTLSHPVPLEAIKVDPLLARLGLVRQPRLAVMPVSNQEFDIIVNGAGVTMTDNHGDK
jgi:predicted RNA-binding protein with PUA-like domain